MIYLDSSAVIKLVRQETGTRELLDWLASQPDSTLVCSVLVEVEVPRALRRYAPSALSQVPRVLAGLYLVAIDDTIRATAASYAEPTFRSLDAIHLATAEVMATLGDPLDAFVAYDRRLLTAAAVRGIPTVSPGQG